MQSGANGPRQGEHHERIEVALAASGPSDRVFGLGGGVMAGGLVAFSYLRSGHVRWWMALATAGLISLALIAPRVLSPLNRAWMSVGRALSRITSPIALGIVYGLTMIPGGLILKLRRRDPLTRAFDRDATTYWVERGTRPNDFTEQF